MHGVVIFWFRHPEGMMRLPYGVIGQACAAEQAETAQLYMRLADFRRRMELRSAQAALVMQHQVVLSAGARRRRWRRLP